MFVPPTWIEGFLIQLLIFIVVPLVVAIIIGIGIGKLTDDGENGVMAMVFAFMILFAIMIPVGSVYWYNAYEVPSVQEKIITVQGWEPRAGISTDSNGMMTIDNADELMMITTENEGFFNMENFLFGKFNTRDILNTMRVNGTYKIKYYGWREGFNSGFPNILSIEEIIDENNTVPMKYSDYFGTKLA